MRIAYISYEYPPDIAQGGIATYTFQVASLMLNRGHDVEVFCGSFERNLSEVYFDVLTHRIKVKNVTDFRDKVVLKFEEQHLYKSFDVFESPEINGNGYKIKQRFPKLPMVVKLHTPAVLQVRILNTYTPFINKLRFVLGALKQGKIDFGYWSRHDKNQYNDIDYLITDMADAIVSPSVSLKQWAINFWGIVPHRIDIIPYPYFPSDEMLSFKNNPDCRVILFVGKLNVHKGLIAYTEAIPKV